MADAKITALTALTAANTADLLAIVDDPAGTPVTKKITKANLLLPEVTEGEDLGSSSKRWAVTYSSQFNAKPGDEFRWNGSSRIVEISDGWLLFKANSGATAKISFTDTSTIRAMLRGNGVNLESRLGDDSAYSGVAASKYFYGDPANNVFDGFGSGTPEGAVTAAVGSTYRRTDGGAATSFYVKESGTGNTGWVAK